jgi:hypothetical protein
VGGLNERGNDFVVKAADPARESVTVDFQGRSLQLVLRTAKVASSGAAAGPRPPAPAVASSVVVNPSMADEQRRLDAVAQEVRRRRRSARRRPRKRTARRPGPGRAPASRPAAEAPPAEISCTRHASG